MAEQDYDYYEGRERMMGTIFRLHAFHPPGEGAWMRELADKLFDTLIGDSKRLSIYESDSQINRINMAAGDRKPVQVDSRTFAILADARKYWELTGGLFDVTAGVLMRYHGYFADAALPDDDDLPAAEELRELTGCDKLHLDPENYTARLEHGGMLLDLGGLAKGWCIQDRIKILIDAGLRDFVISAGTSTVLARGAPPGEDGWPSELEPFGRQAIPGETIILRDNAVSVSANYRNTLTRPDGELVRHIMNPVTKEPVEDERRVVVLGPDAGECEALSTAYLIQGGLSGHFNLQDRTDVSVQFEFPH